MDIREYVKTLDQKNSYWLIGEGKNDNIKVTKKRKIKITNIGYFFD